MQASILPYSQFLETIPDAAMVIEGTGKIVLANSQAHVVFGYQPGGLQAVSIHSLIPDTKTEPIAGFFVNPKTRPMGAGQTLLARRNDGGEFSTDIMLKPIELNGDRLTVCIVRDITMRIQAEETLRASEARYRLLFHSMLDGFALHEIICDEAGKPVDYLFLEVNPAFERLTGLRAADVIGKTVREALPGIEPVWIERYGAVALTGEPTSFADYSRDLDRYYEVSAYCPRRGQFAVLFQDTTRRRQAELLRQALLEIMQGLAVTDDLQAFLSLVHTSVAKVIYAENFFVTLYNTSTDLFEEVYSVDQFDSPAPPSRLEKSISAYVFRTGQPLLLTLARFEELVAQGEVALVGTNSPSWLGVPLKTSQGTIGVMVVQDYQRPDRYSDGDIELLASIASQVASAIVRKQVEQQAQRQLSQLAALRAIDQAISGSLDLPLTLDVFLEQVISQLSVDAADVLLLNQNDQTLGYTAGHGFRTSSFQHARLRRGEGRAGRAALERRIVTETGTHLGPSSARTGLLAQEDFVSYYGVPLIAKGNVLGVLEIFDRAPLQPGAEWLRFLEVLAGQAAIAIEDAQLFAGLQRSNQDLLLAYDTTIEGWSRALDLRDEETEGHTQRVTELAERLARAMGIREADLVHIRRGALLHDIGKMGVPDRILLKPAKLTDEEWAIMRQHPQFAFELLAPIAFLRPALDIPGCHHEKWDGTGYPRGLKGEQIPLAARLFTVADVWDALTSDRPYRKAWSKAEALHYVREQAGQHFDPKAVELFLRVMNEELRE